jgi:hypothetical protein
MKKIIYLFVSILSVLGCNSGKHATDFKTQKQTIDTIALLPVNTNIRIIGGATKDLVNRGLESEIKTSLENLTTDFLKKKYQIQFDTSIIFNYKFNNQAFYELINQCRDRESPLSEVKIPESLNDLFKLYPNRHQLIIALDGHYTWGLSPEEKSSRQVVYLSPMNIAGMNVSVLLVDVFSKKIIHFDESSNSNDPRRSDWVEMTYLNAMKSIYYK